MKTLLLDNSSIELITTCPTKAHYRLHLRRIPNQSQPPQRLGSHIHAALAYRYYMETLGRPWDEETQMRILSKRFEMDPCEDEGWRNVTIAQRAIRCYNEQYGLETLDIVRFTHNGLLVPLVEKPFAIKLGKLGEYEIVWIGRIDLGIRQVQLGLFPFDFKSTSAMGESWWADKEVSEQMRGYCYALKECLGEEPTGYIIQAIAMREPSRTGTSIEFSRRTVYTKEPPGQLEAWRDNMFSQAEEWIWRIERNRFPRFHVACIDRFKHKCDYFDVCNMHLTEEQRLAKLQSDTFKADKWSPLYQ